jgi:hypothetical protein
MAVTYEWGIETLAESPSEANGFDPDIVDTDFRDELRDLPWPSGDRERLVLVRHVGNDVEGETDRLWAYVDQESKSLPRFFEAGGGEETSVEVPKRFHRTIASHAAGGFARG